MSSTSLPPGPRYPIALQTLGWALRPMQWMERCQARYGDVWRMRLAGAGNWVVISDPEVVKEVFRGDPEVFQAGQGNRVLAPLVGHTSVLTLDGAEHMTQRKLMLPPFHGQRMQRYGELMTEIAEREIDSWPARGEMELRPRMQAITLDIILEAVFGLEEGPRLDALRERLRGLLADVTSLTALTLTGFLGPDRLSRLGLVRRRLDPVDTLLLKQIRERRDDPELAEREDILSMLLAARYDDGEPMTDGELRDELVTLLVAGHETTSTSLAWAVERLVRHPGALERLRREVADEGPSGGEYLDAVIKETLRLRPVVPAVARRLTRDTDLAGYRLPAGTNVSPSIHLLHRRPDVYPDPRAFRPERFLEQPAGTYTWIPFGGGVRRCLGASFAEFEMRRVLAALVSRVSLSAVGSEDEGVARRAVTLTPRRGARVAIGVRPARRAPVPA